MKVGHFTPPTIQTKVNNASTGVQRTGNAEQQIIEALQEKIKILEEELQKIPNPDWMRCEELNIKKAELRQLQQLQELDTLHDQLDELLKIEKNSLSRLIQNDYRQNLN